MIESAIKQGDFSWLQRPDAEILINLFNGRFYKDWVHVYWVHLNKQQ